MTIFNEHIDLKFSFFFNIFLGTYRLCFVKETFKYILMVLGSMHGVGFICMLVMAFLRFTLNSYLLVMVLATLISKKFKDLFLFSYSVVYWIAGSCLFRISWKVFPWCFDGKRAWLSSTYYLNVFGRMNIVRASAIALRSRSCKKLSENTTISDKPKGPAFSNNLILFSWRKYDLLKQSSVNLCISVSVNFMRVLRSSKSLFKVSIKTIMVLSVRMDWYKLMTSYDTWISSWVVSHVATSFTNDDEFITRCLK